MAFVFGKRSETHLIGVHPHLVKVTRTALALSDVDFGITEGVRPPEEQRALYNRGLSQIDGYQRIGKHQVQPDGYSHAVDVAAYVDGKFTYDWQWYYRIADAFRMSCAEHGVPVRWGGCWGYTPIHERSGPPEQWVQGYVRRKRAAGKRAFNDGPHYELLGY